MSLVFALLAAVAGLALAGFGVFWVGFQTVPMSYPDLPSAPPEPTASRTPLPDGLPPALAEHFRRVFGLETVGEGLPELATAVVWGRGRYRFYGFLVPMRFRTLHRPGESFYRVLEVTWFGRGVLRIREEYANGTGSRTLEGWAKGHETGEALDETLRQSLWREALWAPTVLATAPWQSLSPQRVSFPTGGFEAALDPKTGRPASLEGGSGGGSWRANLGAWQRFHGIEIPTQVWLRHRQGKGAEEERSTAGPEADAVFVAQGVAYNLDLPQNLRLAHQALVERTRKKTSKREAL